MAKIKIALLILLSFLCLGATNCVEPPGGTQIVIGDSYGYFTPERPGASAAIAEITACETINFAFPGSTAKQWLESALEDVEEDILAAQSPVTVWMTLGANDLGFGQQTAFITAARIEAIVERILALRPDIEVIHSSYDPETGCAAPSIWPLLNVEDPRYEFIDLSHFPVETDECHPFAQGHLERTWETLVTSELLADGRANCWVY